MSHVPGGILLSINEIEGNTTAIQYTKQKTILREKVFAVLNNDTMPNMLHPVHAQSITPRHISALTIELRTYDHELNAYVDYTGSKVALWFKITTDDC